MIYEIRYTKHDIRNKILSLISYLLFLVVFVSHISPVAHAAEFAVGVNPALIKIQTLGGEEIKTPFTVQNMSADPVTLDISYKSFNASQSEEGHVSFLPEGATPPGANPLALNYVKVLDNSTSVTSLTLSPGQLKKLELSIGIPENEPSSDYYFSVLFISKSGQSGQIAAGSGTTAGIGMNVLLTIGEGSSPKVLIEEFSAPFFLQKGPVPFTVRLKNVGDHVITPKGTINITNMFGQHIGQVELLEVNILKDTIRSIPDILQNPDATPSGKYEIRNTKYETKAYWPEKILFGWYTATLSVAAGENSPMMSRNITFIAFPAEAVVGAFLVLLALLFIIGRTRRKLGK